MEEKRRYRIEAIAQAGQVLKIIADSKEPLGVADVTRITGIKPNTAFRILVTLEEVGFLKQVGDKYELGMGLALFWARKKSRLLGLREQIDEDLKALEIQEVEHGE
jgi:DNA-binding IclR family transcriptional regulator